MSSNTDIEADFFLYDAVLTQADPHRRVMVFSVSGAAHTLHCEHAGSFSVGAVGRLRLPSDAQPFAFQIYADQRLRRVPEIDDKSGGRWGWRIGDRRFAVQLGVVPGRNGSVVPRDTKRLELEIPHEFLMRCEKSMCDPAAVVRAFVGDLCSLASPFERPREDGYANHGPESIELANSYFNRAFGEPQAPLTLPRRRGRRPRAEGEGSLSAKPATGRANDRGNIPP
jgi:hypothetical protein